MYIADSASSTVSDSRFELNTASDVSVSSQEFLSTSHLWHQGSILYNEGTSKFQRCTVVNSSGTFDFFQASSTLFLEFWYTDFAQSGSSTKAITASAPTVLVRNCVGLTADDDPNGGVIDCQDSSIGAYCPLAGDHCSDTIVGIDCYCYPDGVQKDPVFI